MLVVENLTKEYPTPRGSLRILSDVSFTLERGDAASIVGPSGCGKSTLLYVVGALDPPTAGTVTLDGATVTSADRRRFGYMPEERGLYPKMKVLEHIVYLARLHGFGKADAESRARALLEDLGLGERLGDNIETLSLGNQQRAL